MSEMSDAFDELLDVDEEVFGAAGSIVIDGDTYACFFPNNPQNFDWVGGGTRDSATPEVWIKKSLFADPPEEGMTAVIGTRALVVLGPIVDQKAFYAITLGTTFGA